MNSLQLSGYMGMGMVVLLNFLFFSWVWSLGPLHMALALVLWVLFGSWTSGFAFLIAMYMALDGSIG